MNPEMPMAEAPNIKKTAFSRKDRHVLGIDLHSWEQLMLLSLGIAGLIAVAVFVTTASVVILQRYETAEAKRELEEYKLDAGKKISDANARAAEATLKANEADLARVKLEEKLSPRRMNQGDQQSVAAQITEFKGQVGGIGSSPQDIESMRLENAIHGALGMAGWNVSRGIPTHTPMWPGGVLVNSTFDKASQLAGVKLALALNSVGIFAVFMPLPDSATPQVFVTVGPKPDPDDPTLALNMKALKQIADEVQKQK